MRIYSASSAPKPFPKKTIFSSLPEPVNNRLFLFSHSPAKIAKKLNFAAFARLAVKNAQPYRCRGV
jgi:hypothetical protein